MSKPLFEAIQEISDRVARASHLFLALDFDGTLTPLKADPQAPRLPPQIDRALRVLADDPGVSVAILSGRERADLQARVDIPGLIYAGNHGLEISGPGRLFVEPTAATYSSGLNELFAVLKQKLEAIPGIIVENKGLTLSVHYRQVPQGSIEDVGRIVHATLASKDHPFVLTHGAKVYEIRPRAYWNKGNAARWIMEQLGKSDALTIYMGDDASDEEAFANLEDGITIRVGGSATTKAKYHLGGTFEVWDFLAWLIRRPKK